MLITFLRSEWFMMGRCEQALVAGILVSRRNLGKGELGFRRVREGLGFRYGGEALERTAKYKDGGVPPGVGGVVIH